MWDLQGMIVTGKYIGEFNITGKVRVSRIAFGGGIKHHIDLDTPIEVYGSIRDSVIINHYDIETVRDAILTN
jgi:hypothetical protein